MLARFKTSKKRPACSDTLGMDLAEVHQDEMRIVVNFTADKSFANPTGAVQGGFIAAMLDEAISTNIIIASNVTMTAPTMTLAAILWERSRICCSMLASDSFFFTGENSVTRRLMPLAYQRALPYRISRSLAS